jgi:hypothetical protein
LSRQRLVCADVNVLDENINVGIETGNLLEANREIVVQVHTGKT